MNHTAAATVISARPRPIPAFCVELGRLASGRRLAPEQARDGRAVSRLLKEGIGAVHAADDPTLLLLAQPRADQLVQVGLERLRKPLHQAQNID